MSGLLRSRLLVGFVVGLSVVGAVPPPSVEAQAAFGPPEAITTPQGTLRSTDVAVPAADGVAQRASAPPSVAVPEGTQMAGVTWSGSEELQLRARTEGAWSEWVDLHVDGPDGATRNAAGPVWLGEQGADAVQVRAVGGAVSSVRVSAMTWTAARSPRALVADRPSSTAGGPTIYTRASWAPGGWVPNLHPTCGARPQSSSALRFAVVHHTDSTNSYSAGAVPGILAGIYNFHVHTNRWCDIAYNFFVDRFGRVWEGRSGGVSSPIAGGHAKGFNTDSVGVAFLGVHGSSGPTAGAWTAMRDTLAWKLGSHGVDPQSSVPIVSNGSTRYPEGTRVTLPAIQGHRDSGLTSCPGNAAYNQLGWLRGQVAARIAAVASSTWWRPERTGAGFFGRIEARATGRIQPNGQAGTFTSLVTRAGWSRDALAGGLVLAPSSLRRVGAVERLYRAAFGRYPDTGGLRYWVGARDAGLPFLSMARRFTIGSEFRDRYDALDDPTFVAAMYRNVLRRDPDEAGAAWWVQRLDGGMTRFEVLASFAESAENKARTERSSLVTTVTFVLLDRAPWSAERVAWDDAFAAGATGQDMVTMVLSSSEFTR